MFGTSVKLGFWVLVALQWIGLSSQAQISSNAHSGRFTRGTGDDPTYHSFVVPIDFQKGVTATQALGGTLYHVNATNTGPQTNLSNRIAFTTPIAAFGSKYGAGPLYLNESYRFGIYAGNPMPPGYPTSYRTNAILISVVDKTTFTNVGTVAFTIPTPAFSGEWSAFLNGGATYTSEYYGLKTTYASVPGYPWGTRTEGSWMMTHEASGAASNYLYTIWIRGATDKGSTVILESGGTQYAYWSPLYSLDFDQRKAWQPVFIDQPHFEGEPLPPTYQGKSLEELLAVSAVVTNAVASAATNWLDLDNSPELRTHPTLDQFVTDMRSNALALAAYVFNEIELTDGIAYNDAGTGSLAQTSINLGGINRSALGVFMEGQGSPAEQCALLVYLLRRSGVPAAYIYPPDNGVKMLDARLSKLLRQQIKGAVNDDGKTFTTNTLISVNYPWVAARVGGQWIHLFPWLKDTELVEGLNLYEYMSANYDNGHKWVRNYLYGDTNIFSLSDETDLPSILFPRFVENSLLTTAPGISLDDLGVRAFNRRHQYARWTDFPTPFSVTNGTVNTVKDLTSITNISPTWTNIFDTVSVEVFSNVATNKRVWTGTMRMADLHNRKFLVRHQPNGSNFDVILSLAPYRPSATNQIKNFTNDVDFLYAQTNRALLASTDDQLTVRLTHKRHRTLPTGTSTNDHWASYLGFTSSQDFVAERPMRKGDLAAICLNPGKVSKRMVEVYAEEYWDMQRKVKANPSLTNTLSKDITQGTLPYLMGMSYYERVSRSLELLENLHKTHVGSIYAAGLSMLGAKRDTGGTLITPIQLHHPFVDMLYSPIAVVGNGSLHLDSGDDRDRLQDDFSRILAAEASAQEHAVIQSFYSQKGGISTVSLLRLARQSGQPGMLELNKNNYASYNSLYSYDSGIWKSVTNAFAAAGAWDSNYVQVYITAAPVTSTNASYKGMAALILSYRDLAALISGNQYPINGGWGARLSYPIYSPPSYDYVSLLYSHANTSWNVSYAAPTPSTPSFLSPVVSWWEAPTTQSYISSGALSFGGWNLTQQSQFELASYSVGTSLSSAFGDTFNYGGSYQSGVGAELAQLAGTVADPVNVLSGEFYIEATDLTLPGPMPLLLRRNYSSHNLDLGEHPFGYGWRPAWQPYLRMATNLIYATEMDGTVIAYRQPTAGTNFWKPFPADNPHLNNRSSVGIGGSVNMFNAWITNSGPGATTNYYLGAADGSVRRYRCRDFPLSWVSGYERSRPWLEEWKDARGNSYTLDYGTNSTRSDYAQVRRILSSNGNLLGLVYDPFAQIIEAYTGDGRRLFYDYDSHGDLVKVTFPDSSEIEYEYQHQTTVTNGVTNIYSTHLVIKEIKPDGRLLKNEYDSQRRVTNQWATVGPDLKLVRNASFRYTNDFNLTNFSTVSGTTTVLDYTNNATTYFYTNDLIRKIRDPFWQQEGEIVQTWYEANETNAPAFPRSLKTATDKRGLATTYLYDERGNQTNATVRGDLRGDGDTNATMATITTYNSRNLPERMIDPTGATNLYFYTNNWLLSRVEVWPSNAAPTQAVTNLYTYYFVSNNGIASYGMMQREIRAANSPDAATNEWTHDARGFVTQRVQYTGTGDPAITNWLFYNDKGELIDELNGVGHRTIFDYDMMGRLKYREVYAAGQAVPLYWEDSYYNENGELTWTDGPRYDPEDYVWRDYDGAGRQTTEIHWRSQAKADGSGVESPMGDDLYATAYKEYDAFGNLKRTINPRGAVTTNTWDALGRMIRRQSLETNGTVLATEGFVYEPGGKVRYQTNALGGVTETQYTWTGQPKFQKNPDGSTNGWRYYADGRLATNFLSNGSYWRTIFDGANRRQTRIFHSAAHTALETNITELDRRGNSVRTVDAAGNAFTNLFDGLNRLKFAMGPRTIFTNPPGLPQIGDPPPPIQQAITNFYDASGVVVTNVNALGEKSITYLDAIGRPTRSEIRSTNALIREVNYAYTPNHHGAFTTNGSGANTIASATYTDNDGHAVLSIAYPNAGVREFVRRAYDWTGNAVFEGHYSVTNGNPVLWSYVNSAFDGLNRLRSTTDRDNAPTAFDYNAMGSLTNRTMPGGLKWRAEYNAAGQMTKSFNVADASGTRTNTYTYYAANSPFAGLLQTHTDGRGVVRTATYDAYLRPLTNNYTGSLAEHNFKTVFQYDVRGLVTNLTENFTNTSVGPATAILRGYDPYGQLATEFVSVNGVAHSGATLVRDSAGRSRQLAISSQASTLSYYYGWRADGLLGGIGTAYLNGNYGYTTAGLLNSRTLNGLSVNVTSRDGAGRVLTQSSAVNNITRLTESLSWTSDGLLSAHTVTRTNDFTDARSYDYASLSRRLAAERVNLDASKRWTNIFTYDEGASGGPGVLTKVAEPQAGGAAWEASVDAFDRVERETNNVIRRLASGRMNATNGQATASVTLDGRALAVNTLGGADSTWPLQWQSMMELRPGTHTLQAVANHSSGQFSTNKNSSFTNNAVDQTTLSHFAEGQLSYRVWKNAAGQTNRVQTFTWDARSRLLATSELDSNNNGYNWSAVYDALGRRLQTTTIIVTNGVALNGQPKTINSVFDPQVEFLELGVKIGGKTTWKICGPDLNGAYGAMNGTGGLDGLVDEFGIFSPVIADARGNVHGKYDTHNANMQWNASRPTGYGAVPEYRPVALADNGDLAVASAWNGRWADLSGLYWLGARYYDPVSGSFVSCDPLGHNGEPNLYGFCDGDPVNYFDPDGRLGKPAWSSPYSSISDYMLPSPANEWFSSTVMAPIEQLKSDLAYNNSFVGAYHQTQAQMAMAWNMPATPTWGEAFSSALNFTPLVGGVKMYLESGFTGSDLVTGQRVGEMGWGAAAGITLNLLSAVPMAPRGLSFESSTFSRTAAESAPAFKTWNQFQAGTAGQFASRAEAGQAWSVYKEANGILTGSSRSSAARSEYLKSLVNDWRTPSWQKQWLSQGQSPPGYEVDHIKPLSIGGADTPANMRLQGADIHTIHHSKGRYRPWE